MHKHLKAILIGMWVVVGLAVAGVGGAVWLFRDHPGAPAALFVGDPGASAAKLPVLFDAPAFTLTDQTGHPFDATQLHGHVWAADFVYTHCTSFCPLMTQSMHDFQRRTSGVQMVSFTVDPDRDTPAVLAEYAKGNAADLSRWHFLTGDQPAMVAAANGMKLAVGPGDSAMEVMHSSHFLLVDAEGHVRGVYDFKDAGFLNKMVADANALVAEAAGRKRTTDGHR